MRVIKDNRLLELDWCRVADDEPLPEGAKPIVSLARWQKEREQLLQWPGGVGVWLSGDDPPSALVEDLGRLELIALQFPTFGDGRCFSHARLLRERYGYRGDLLAVGDVLRDQLFYMQRCGINVFPIREDKDPQDALKAFGEFSVKYQTAADHAEPIYRVRHPQ